MRDEKKRERQRLLESVLKEREVPTQAELVEILRSMGCEATQSSIARDIVEMGVQKIRGLYGRSRYVLPGQDAVDPMERARGALEAFCLGIEAAGMVVIVSTSINAAQTMGTALDGLRYPDIAGSLAGFDTVVLFCRSTDKAESVRDYLEALRNGR